MSSLPEATSRRIQVLDLRQRLEKAAAFVFDQVCRPLESGHQNRIRERLTFIYAIESSILDSSQHHRLIQQTRHIYKKSSDVMHGRANMVNLPQVIIDEWRDVIESLEEVVKKLSTGQDAAPP